MISWLYLVFFQQGGAYFCIVKRVAVNRVNSNEVVLMSSGLTKNLLDKYRSI